MVLEFMEYITNLVLFSHFLSILKLNIFISEAHFQYLFVSANACCFVLSRCILYIYLVWALAVVNFCYV